MTRDEFLETVRVIGKGGDVDQEELVDVLNYAGTAWYEIQELTKSLCSGYRRLQVDIQRKDRKMEATNRLLTAVRAENERLRERVKECEGTGERIATSPSASRNDKRWDGETR